MIYLDHNATAPLLPEVADAMAECDRQAYANPASQHAAGRRARGVIEDAREEIAAILGANLTAAAPDRLVFTSGGTEANNLAIFGLAGESPARLAISAIEHPSVAGPAELLQRRDWQVDRLPVSREGLVTDAAIAELLTQPRPALVSVMLANNETGVLQPVAQLVSSARAAGVPVHTDAVQVVGKMPVDFRALGVTALTFTAHKFHGPRGIGGLLLSSETKLQPMLFGGFQQGGLRPGTESVSLVVGMLAALRHWQHEQAERMERMSSLRDRLERALCSGWPDAIVFGSEVPRLPHTSNIAFPGLDRQTLVVALDLAGVACSTGSACASGSSEPSPTLLAMGCDDRLIQSSLRFSLGARTTAAEVDQAAERILQICNDLRSRRADQKSGERHRQKVEKRL